MDRKFRIGLFTSAWDAVAWELVSTVHRAIQAGTVLNAEIAFLLCTREEGETYFGDFMIQNAKKQGLPLVTFSSLRFKSDLRKRGRESKRAGDSSIIEAWRNQHDLAIAKLIPATDLDVLLGYMWECSETMCSARTVINLHPALPWGPKGTFKEVIRELVKTRVAKTGVMMHLVTHELDRGAAVSFCHFPIRGGGFDPLWRGVDDRDENTPLEEDNPLFTLIRREGVRREIPLVIEAIKSLAAGDVMVRNGSVIDRRGTVLTGGYDLTQEIEAAIQSA